MKKVNKKGKKLKTSSIWGGRFNKPNNDIMIDINSSIDIDKILFKQDIFGSSAHAMMLFEKNILTKKELNSILNGLKQIEYEIDKDKFKFSKNLEDIHMNIEYRLTELIGEPAKKLHTGRSRNDQVATDIRLWIRDSIENLDHLLMKLQKVLIDKSEKNIETIMPGFTHLQTAQPITFGFHLMSYVFMIGRDRSRLKDCSNRLNESPLGAGALSGTSFPIDRNMTSKLLGFKKPLNNAMDAVSSRDFAVEFLSSLCICSIHLSRLAEEIILWSSQQFNFIKLSDEMTTGSSMMPQKRNPDAAELIRAKVGTISGNLLSLITILKGLPLAYSKDMQEDKLPIFSSYETLILSINSMHEMLRGIKVNKENMRKAAELGHSIATDLADTIVKELGISFREAHGIVGEIVLYADKKKIPISALRINELKNIDTRLTKLQSDFSILHSIKSKISYGSTSVFEVRKQIKSARKMYLSSK